MVTARVVTEPAATVRTERMAMARLVDTERGTARERVVRARGTARDGVATERPGVTAPGPA
ncbi:hypothetical protein Mame01_47280 [Microbispora amethystogenes]|nr:hypothetical protein Mame01_47280 [Microbispora amethystogenes]